MLLIKTEIKTSTIPNAGLGLFTLEDIAKDAAIWVFDEEFDKCFTDEQVKSFNDIAKSFIKKYAFKDNGVWILGSDFDIFQNSDSKLKNIGEVTVGAFPTEPIIALRDIKAGEELISDYSEWDDCHFEKFCYEKQTQNQTC